MNQSTQEHTLSYRALFRVALVCSLILLAWLARDAVIALSVACVLTAALHPVVTKIHTKLTISMLFATLLFFVALLVPFVVIGYFSHPLLVNQIPMLFVQIDIIISKIPLISQTFPDFSIAA
jgi:predicted PurR-regulated permease PerM